MFLSMLLVVRYVVSYACEHEHEPGQTYTWHHGRASWPKRQAGARRGCMNAPAHYYFTARRNQMGCRQ